MVLKTIFLPFELLLIVIFLREIVYFANKKAQANSNISRSSSNFKLIRGLTCYQKFVFCLTALLALMFLEESCSSFIYNLIKVVLSS